MLLIDQDCNLGKLVIQHQFTYQNISKLMFIVNKKLKFEINDSSNPNVSDMVNPLLNTKLYLDSTDDIYDYEYHILFGYGVADFTKGDNIIYRDGIYSYFSNADCIWVDGNRYEIDKPRCTPDYLFLKSPLKSDDINQIIYKSIIISGNYSYTCSIENELKKRILSDNGCQNCKPDDIFNALQYLTALKINTDCADISSKKRMMNQLKNILNLKQC